MTRIKQFLVAVGVRLNLVALATVAALYGFCDSAFATTDADNIDYSGTASSVLSKAEPAIVAGVTLLVVILGISMGKKLWGKVSGVK